MEEELSGFALPMRLFVAFRVFVDHLQTELAKRGYADMRPMHGFVLSSVNQGASHTDLVDTLGISDEAVTKMVSALRKSKYLEHTRLPDGSDGVQLTFRGEGARDDTTRIVEEFRDRWAELIGTDRLTELANDLRTLAIMDTSAPDTESWVSVQLLD